MADQKQTVPPPLRRDRHSAEEPAHADAPKNGWRGPDANVPEPPASAGLVNPQFIQPGPTSGIDEPLPSRGRDPDRSEKADK